MLDAALQTTHAPGELPDPLSKPCLATDQREAPEQLDPGSHAVLPRKTGHAQGTISLVQQHVTCSVGAGLPVQATEGTAVANVQQRIGHKVERYPCTLKPPTIVGVVENRYGLVKPANSLVIRASNAQATATCVCKVGWVAVASDGPSRHSEPERWFKLILPYGF